MLYLIGQILICLCFAAALGFAVGWLLRGPGSRAEIDGMSEEWRVRESALRRDIQRQREAAQDLERRLDDAKTAYRKAAVGEEKLAQALNEAHRKTRPDSDALTKAREELARALEVSDKHRRQANGLSESLAESRDRAQQLETELTEARRRPVRPAARRATDKQQPADLDEATARIAQSESRSLDRDKRILDLSRALEAAAAKTAQVEEQLAAARKALADQRQVAPSPTTQPARKPSTTSAGDARQGDLLGPGQKPGEPMPAMPGTRPGWLLRQPEGSADDLKEIYGIGPVLESRLNQLGVFHFSQIARLTANDVAWVAARINSFPDRIVRDRWVEQARRLAQEAGNGR